MIYTSIIVDYKGNLPIFVMGDNVPMLNALHTDSKEVSIRNSASKTRVLADLLTNKFAKIEINFGWVPGPKNPADLASKGMDKPVAACNGPLWREGPLCLPTFMG